METFQLIVSPPQPQKRGFRHRRTRTLSELIGLADKDAEDISLSGRLRTISKLRTARQAEIARGQSGSWLYDINRHLNICTALRCEYEALADYLDATDAIIWRRSTDARCRTLDSQSTQHDIAQ